MTDWVERLQEILAEKAKAEFAHAVISIDAFTHFVKETTFVPDWDIDFIKAAYNKYLQKVTDAGLRLTEKIQDGENG
ncbi:MAG: hypothetical protein M3Q97_01390 [Bacteroidota bacterium]|nr:hypothetical protein [Bacteroidota bacterium]